MNNTDKVKALNTAKDTIISEMADTLRSTVNGIESSIKTTQHHYGAYMGLLSQFTDKATREVVAMALIQAGANKRGIASALSMYMTKTNT